MSGTTTAVKPARGPRWTRKRLIDMLQACYGPSTRGPLDVAAVARYAVVTPTTVRRWIKGDGQASRVRPRIPKQRIIQLQRAPEDVEVRNEQQYQYALEAIAKVQRGDILTSWSRQGWLDEHTVAIVDIHGKPWHQVVVTKANTRAMTEIRRRATILSVVMQPTRFHAQVLARTVMMYQQYWRVHPTAAQLPSGRTQVWMSDAAAVDLIALSAAALNQRSAKIEELI